jgi:phosphoribosylanthranilate isomerase
MFDTRRGDLWGGTGETFDWDLLAGRHSDVPSILAGGLRPDNVAAAIEVARPFAVDVASGVEAVPGRKDHELLASFFDAARAATPTPAQ